MTKGTVKTITDKGFGFISQEGEEKDLFFHANDVVGDSTFDDLREGDEVEFEVSDSDKGPKAANVEKV